MASSRNAQAGDVLAFCADGAAATGIVVKLVDAATQEELGSHSFASVAQCV